MDLNLATDKSTLFSKLDVRIITDAPRNVDACIVDGMSLVQSTAFGGQANLTLSRLVRRAIHVDFACDTFKNLSINDITEVVVWYRER